MILYPPDVSIAIKPRQLEVPLIAGFWYQTFNHLLQQMTLWYGYIQIKLHHFANFLKLKFMLFICLILGAFQ